MKLKTLSLVAGAIALSLTATPFAVKAETALSSPLVVAQTPQKERGPWRDLGLTEQQKGQFRVIDQKARADFEALLTPEQKAKWEAAKQARQARQQAGQQQPGQRQPGEYRRRDKGFAELGLSDQQKEQARQIWKSAREQKLAVLTPEQQAKLKQFQENMRQRRQQRDR